MGKQKGKDGEGQKGEGIKERRVREEGREKPGTKEWEGRERERKGEGGRRAKRRGGSTAPQTSIYGAATDAMGSAGIHGGSAGSSSKSSGRSGLGLKLLETMAWDTSRALQEAAEFKVKFKRPMRFLSRHSKSFKHRNKHY